MSDQLGPESLFEAAGFFETRTECSNYLVFSDRGKNKKSDKDQINDMIYQVQH